MKAVNKYIGMVGMIGLFGLLSACNDDFPREQKDWANTTEWLNSSDEVQSLTYYKPSAGSVGDPLPFYDPVARNFKVLYLHNFEQNMEQTFHPLWGVETNNGGAYTSLGEVLPMGRAGEQDAALGTGCVVYDEARQLYYIYYTGEKYQPAAGEDRQVVMRATSTDFKSWTKDPLFRLRGLDYGYSSLNFRDPYIWRMDDGWHMIVATKQVASDNGMELKEGVFAEFVSADLVTWQHQGVFAKMIWDRFMECPNVFQMGDWWYLTYSDMAAFERRVHYLKAHTIEELRAATSPQWPDDKEGALDSRAFYAGNTASDGTTRYMWGWCPERRNKDNTDIQPDAEPKWGGTLVMHQLLQREDGTLALAPVQGISEQYAKHADIRLLQHFGEEYTLADGTYTMPAYCSLVFNSLSYHNHISLTVSTENKADRFGISFSRGSRDEEGTEKYYSIMLCPEADGAKHYVRFEEEGGKWELKGGGSYAFPTPDDNTYHINIFTDNSVLVMYVNDCLAYTCRIYGLQRNCWSVNCYEGKIELQDINLSIY